MPKLHKNPRPQPGTEPVAVVGVERPALGTAKGKWVAYADSIGVDSSGTKDEIIGRIDG
jgi:hypothetical protein